MSNVRPNILLITIDSLRADHLSLYGYERETTPWLSLFAENAAVYDRAISPAGWTGPAVASILTGFYPTTHGYTNRYYYLDESVPTLATRLQQVDYETALFSNNIYIGPETGIGRGFDQCYYQGRPILEQKRQSAKSRWRRSVPRSLKVWIQDRQDAWCEQRALERDKGAAATERSIFSFLHRRNQSRPFFAYVHFQEPHSIYFPPLPFRRRYFPDSLYRALGCLEYDFIGFYAGRVRFEREQMDRYGALYDGEIAYIDWRLGRLFRHLQDKGLLDSTIVVIAADHGECFGENGYLWHAFCIYQPLIRVPLIIRHPEWFKAGINSDLVQTVDLVPTLLNGLDIDMNDEFESQGQSLLTGSKRQAALTEYFEPQIMIERWLQRRTDLSREDLAPFNRRLTAWQTEERKFILSSDGRHEFYDLHQDPCEQNNLYRQTVHGEEQEAIKKWIARLPVCERQSQHEGFDKATWEKLKKLGYA
ncbi:sulfatase [candidate division KSB1 bacterium]|nr:sulfatase [candidate division KSB1 bacterium]